MHTIGTRIFYCAFLILIWLFGPIPMVFVSILLTVMLYSLDYVTVQAKSDAAALQ